MSASPDSLGIIAGSRSLPFLVAGEARKSGVRKIVAVAVEGETDSKLAAFVDEIVWLRVGQLSKLIKVFKERGVQHCVMAGQIAPKNLFDVRPDLRAVILLLKLKEKNAHSIFGGIAQELASCRHCDSHRRFLAEWLRAISPWSRRTARGCGTETRFSGTVRLLAARMRIVGVPLP